jgi:type IV fimbrial biogenesis protein FimT
MRLLKSQAGLTLIELMMAIVVGALLVSVGVPYFGEYFANSRLREGGHAVMAEALFAQSEAIKRNTTVRMAVLGDTITSTESSTGTAVTLRSRTLANGLSVNTSNVDFTSRGTTTPFGTSVNLNLDMSGVSCTAYRCPRVVIDGGGGVRLCANKNACP